MTQVQLQILYFLLIILTGKHIDIPIIPIKTSPTVLYTTPSGAVVDSTGKIISLPNKVVQPTAIITTQPTAQDIFCAKPENADADNCG